MERLLAKSPPTWQPQRFDTDGLAAAVFGSKPCSEEAGVSMKFEVTDQPREEDERFVIAQTRAYNSAFTEKDARRLCVFVRDESGSIVGGLTAKTLWGYLDIAFLWVSATHRGQDFGSKLMDAAEKEALTRGCERALVNTFSFQALGFYEKRGYIEFGRLQGFSGKHSRHYLFKHLR